MLQDLAQRSLERAREKIATATSVASTGVRVQKPSDDPVAFAAARRESARESTARSSERTADLGYSLASGADDALAGVGEAISRAKELAVQLSNGTLTAEDRAAASAEVRGLRADIADLGNTEVQGVYVFGGYLDGAPPFDATTGAYAGDDQVRRVEVAPHLHLPIAVPGGTTFGAGTATDILATLDRMATALDTNDIAGVRGSITGLDASLTRVNDARSELGTQMLAFEGARAGAQIAQDRGASTRAALVEVDPYRAYSDLANAETALQAAVAVASKLPFNGLVNGGG
jgi:flagellar hook-associated protein 3 FlgL